MTVAVELPDDPLPVVEAVAALKTDRPDAVIEEADGEAVEL